VNTRSHRKAPKKKLFQSIVYGNYALNRRALPWRDTTNPYRILLSELMLQQTQVERVLEKYRLFVQRFPTVSSVAKANLRGVLDAWSGLGYNRRALSLKRLAEIVVKEHRGRIPRDPKLLMQLPGVGKATAGAVCAFAFNKPVVFLETNIRAVFIHHFFSGEKHVKDSEILPIAEKMLDKKNPRRWYSALMDYGVSLKKLHGNPARRSAHHRSQSSFAGSDRQIRGEIIKLLVRRKAIRESSLCAQLLFPCWRVRKMIKALAKEGFIKKRGAVVSICG
jgi:A/G-specific adenine glycosylase